jgi:hypothetical protein
MLFMKRNETIAMTTATRNIKALKMKSLALTVKLWNVLIMITPPNCSFGRAYISKSLQAFTLQNKML